MKQHQSEVAQGRRFEFGVNWRHYAERGARGMDPWRDLLDWVGACRSKSPSLRKSSIFTGFGAFGSSG